MTINYFVSTDFPLVDHINNLRSEKSPGIGEKLDTAQGFSLGYGPLPPLSPRSLYSRQIS
jgi:hypothetical protein